MDLHGKQLRCNLLNKLGIVEVAPPLLTPCAGDRSLRGNVPIIYESLKDHSLKKGDTSTAKSTLNNDSSSSSSSSTNIFVAFASLFASHQKTHNDCPPQLDECSDTASSTSRTSLRSLSMGSEDEQDFSLADEYDEEAAHVSLISPMPKGVRFNPDVAVLQIPTRQEYSQRIKQHLWYTASQLQVMQQRNTIEFAADGFNVDQVCEEDEHYRSKTTGELIHPIHFEIAMVLRQRRGLPVETDMEELLKTF